MAGLKGIVASAIVCVAIVAPNFAMAGVMSKAEKLRRLDIMLMVTGLRCRAGVDDFQGDFAKFEARHMPELNRAAQDLRIESASLVGGQDEHAVDRISTAMANTYGGGHPWLGCHDLKGLAHQLSETDGEGSLVQAADEALTGDGPAQSLLGSQSLLASR